MKAVDFDRAPLLAIWEITRACALACRHCRASAQDLRDPQELSLDEGRKLIDEVAALGTPLMVLTGGDPLQRDDLEDLIGHGKSLGLIMATIPAATGRLTRDRVFRLAAAGIDQLALSLDASTTAVHDAFRQVEGTFARVMAAAAWIREAGIPLQFNTVLGSWNLDDFDDLARMVADQGAAFWEIFFLVPTGRGTDLTGCTAEETELLFEKIHRVAVTAPFTVKVTEGQHFRRWFAQHDDVDRLSAFQPGRRVIASRPVNAGNGFVFVDHRGEVFPSGFLPVDCGNVRNAGLAEIYRDHPVFRELRNLDLLEGRCGRCDHRDLCSGGSRARTFGATGTYLGSDPSCAHLP